MYKRQTSEYTVQEMQEFKELPVFNAQIEIKKL